MKTHKIYGHHLKGSGDKQNWYIGRTSKDKIKYRFGTDGNGYKNCPKFHPAIQDHGWDAFEHVFIAECETKEQAILAEAIFKKMYDSVENGYNCSQELEDWKESVPWNKGKSGYKRSDEAKANMSNAAKNRCQTPEGKQQLDAAREASKSPESKAKQSKSAKERGITKETREKMNASHRITCSTPEYKQKSSQINKGKTWKLIDGKRVWLENHKQSNQGNNQ